MKEEIYLNDYFQKKKKNDTNLHILFLPSSSSFLIIFMKSQQVKFQ